MLREFYTFHLRSAASLSARLSKLPTPLPRVHPQTRSQTLEPFSGHTATVADVCYRRKQNTSPQAPAALYAPYALGIAQLVTYKRNEVLSLCIDEADGLLIGVAQFEQVIGNVESG